MNHPPRTVEFIVAGHPQPAGSKRAFPRKGGGVIVTDDNPNAKPWMAAIASQALTEFDGQMPLDGPLKLTVLFTLARPKGHYGTGRHTSHVVRPRAPRFPVTRPDLTKLVRAVEDALTGSLWTDDAQVVTQSVAKRYGFPERTLIRVSEIQV